MLLMMKLSYRFKKNQLLFQSPHRYPVYAFRFIKNVWLTNFKSSLVGDANCACQKSVAPVNNASFKVRIAKIHILCRVTSRLRTS